MAEVAIAPYPFTTIHPNRGSGYVKVDCAETFFKVKCNPRLGYCINGKRFVPVELLDVAGLVPGAHEGVGLGNQFLDDLNQADLLIHIVDVSGSANEKGEIKEPLSHDPANDIKFLEHELDMWYLRLIKKGWERFARSVNQEKPNLNKAIAKQLSALRVTEKITESLIQKLKLPEDIMKWDDAMLLNLATELRKITKPMIIACNKADIKGADENFSKLKQRFPDYHMVACSAESELALREAAKHNLIQYIPGEKTFAILHEEKLNEQQKKALAFIQHNVLDKYGSTGIQDVLDHAVYQVLNYIAIFPGGVNKLSDSKGNVMPDCFLLPRNSTALDFAYKLHTDLGNKFIRAIDVKTKRTVGKEHVLNHCDVIEIVANK